MNEVLNPDRRKKLFFWGMVLAWTSLIPLLIGLFNAFRGVSMEKATGLAAVAGGLTEIYVTLGLVLSLALPLAAIVLLGRSLSGASGVRALFSVFSICWSALVLILCSLGAWAYLIELPRLGGGAR
jgi:hypothetical protein